MVSTNKDHGVIIIAWKNQERKKWNKDCTNIQKLYRTIDKLYSSQS
jgi:ABC-type xylose transport system substrate-binding protein